jgi:hypothetical protein
MQQREHILIWMKRLSPWVKDWAQTWPRELPVTPNSQSKEPMSRSHCETMGPQTGYGEHRDRTKSYHPSNLQINAVVFRARGEHAPIEGEPVETIRPLSK